MQYVNLTTQYVNFMMQNNIYTTLFHNLYTAQFTPTLEIYRLPADGQIYTKTDSDLIYIQDMNKNISCSLNN
jgi:hypothetical protein